MTEQELNAKTVIALRKLAKEMGVKLGAGISKEGIVQKLVAAQPADASEDAPASTVVAAPAADEAPAPEQLTLEDVISTPAPVATPVAPIQPAPMERPAPVRQPAPAPREGAKPIFKAAWQAQPSAPRHASKHSGYQPSPYAQRQPWQGKPAAPKTPAPEMPRLQTVRPQGFKPRFGPAPVSQPAAPMAEIPARVDSYAPPAPAPVQETPSPRPTRPAFTPASRREPASGYNAPAASGYQPPFPVDASAPTARELMDPIACRDGSGVLELHPDGYGFLRSKTMMPSSKDIHVSLAQIRRFGLRGGDFVEGKVRAQRDGDKFASLLVVNSVNGRPPEEAMVRPLYEDLTPMYPNRRITLENSQYGTPITRLADLITPIGFGQRGLLLCPPCVDKTELLQSFANAIATNHPKAKVLVMLLDKTPEDIALFRESSQCTVVASAFDSTPEGQLRLTDLVLEKVQRMVEYGHDVVLVMDSLTRMSKFCPTNATQRTPTGMVNPSSLFKAKRLFGAARALKEGGSLTILATMDVDTGSKVDDVVVEEFAGTANMQLLLDSNLAAQGIMPPVNISASGTRKEDLLLSETQKESLHITRSLLSSLPAKEAIPQLMQLMDTVDSTDTFLARMQEWSAMMNR